MAKDVFCLTHGFPAARMGSIEACGCKEACDAVAVEDTEPCADCGFFGPGGYMYNVCTCGESDPVDNDPCDV